MWQKRFKKYKILGVVLIFSPFSLLSSKASSLETSQVETSTEWNQTPLSSILFRGNKTVDNQGLLNVMKIQVGSIPAQDKVAQDIQSLYALGYFDDIRFLKDKPGTLIVTVVERPTVESIQFYGFHAVSSETLKEKLATKKYTIVDTKLLVQDLKTIEQEYTQAGYALAHATYTLEQIQPGVVRVIFMISESSPVTVRRVDFIGNTYFSEQEMIDFLNLKPYSWMSELTSSGIFREEYLSGDQNNLAYMYRDHGYAEATVTTPTALLDESRTQVDVMFYIEPGESFHIGKVTFSGDLIESDDALREHLSLNEGNLYRISKFSRDMKSLKTFYGDHGYAFAYVYPSFHIDRLKKTYDIEYHFTKGERTYFKRIEITGNLKTRDNVIRRNLAIAEGELFNETNLDRSKEKLNRLGYFKDVAVIRQDDAAHNAVNVKVQVTEKSTGSVSAGVGASPNTNGTTGVMFFGNLSYKERDMLGYGYGLNTSMQMSPNPESSNMGDVDYTLSASFINPSIYDSPWSYSISGSYSKTVTDETPDSSVYQTYLTQKTGSAGVSLGREIFVDNLRASLGLSIANTASSPSNPLLADYFNSGRTQEFSQSLVYDSTDNYIAPTKGFNATLANAVGVEWGYGQYKYGRLAPSFSAYLPIPYTESFISNFRWTLMPQWVYQLSPDDPVPYWKRLQLGNSYYMKGYSGAGERISPVTEVTLSPLTGQTLPIYIGGNQSYYSSLEYFIPILPEANLRGVLFAEAGEVLDDYQRFSPTNIKYDIGFGFRWYVAAIGAPFRFEWAFPVNGDYSLGSSHFIFTVGGDDQSMSGS